MTSTVTATSPAAHCALVTAIKPNNAQSVVKKVVILLTIFLISCGSENGTAELDYPAKEVNGVSLVDCLVSKGWENIPTIELRGDRVHLIFDEPFDVERYDVLQEECLQELHDVASQSEEEGTEAVEEIVVLETQKKRGK